MGKKVLVKKLGLDSKIPDYRGIPVQQNLNKLINKCENKILFVGSVFKTGLCFFDKTIKIWE